MMVKADVVNENSGKHRCADSSSAATSLFSFAARKRLLLTPGVGRGLSAINNLGQTRVSPRQVNIMNNEIYLAKNLLAELREAYRGLPRHMQVRVASLLRESAPKQQSDAELVCPESYD